MVIDEIDVTGVSAFETKNHPPIPAYEHRPEALAIATQRMQPEAGSIHILGLGRSIEPRKDALYLGDEIRPYLAAIAAIIKALQATMFESSYHGLI
jgi:hypothetical protein